MIKNIIFDMGQVLREFNPYFCIRPYLENEEDVETIKRVCFESPQWMELDHGTITYEEALTIWKAKLPNRLHAVTDRIIADWHLYLPEISEMTELVKILYANGYDLYLLSNVSVRFSESMRDHFEALTYMKGYIASAENKLLKPEPAIYQLLLSRFHLLAEECVFIDDVPANIAGGEAVGIAGIVFDGDVQILKQKLKKLQITI
jgi:putative hydrolase of the HAD superfamily